MNKYTYVVFILLIFAVGCSAKEELMEDLALYQVLERSLKDHDYLNIIKSTENYEFEKVKTEYFKEFNIYKFVSLDPSGVSHDFIFTIRENSNDIILLTESVEEFNQLNLPINEIVKKGELDLFIGEVLLLSRPFYRMFEIINSKKKADEWLVDEGGIRVNAKPLNMIEISENEFKGSVLILIGKNLINRNVLIRNGMVSFEDVELKKNASRFLDPHD